MQVPDDGLRCRQRGGHGGSTSQYPCGHPRSVDNTADGIRCRSCRNRLRRERYARETRVNEAP